MKKAAKKGCLLAEIKEEEVSCAKPLSATSSGSRSGSSDSDDTGSDFDSISDKKSKSKNDVTKGKLKSKSLFSDENAAWLKPKQKEKKAKTELIPNSDDNDGYIKRDVNNDEYDIKSGTRDHDQELELEVEKQSCLLDAKIKLQTEQAEEELRKTIETNTFIYHLPTKEELELDVDRFVPPSELKAHIESILEVLSNFKERREPERSRKEYLDQLGLFIAELYGYLPELVEYFLTMFSPPEALEFVDYSDKVRPLVIRTNTLKTRRKDLALALMKRGVSLDPLASWSKVGLKIMESPVPVGATPEYLSGHYMLQSAASMCPVLALSPQPKERLLDMSAAPGGKTSYLAQLMRNTGIIFANDLRADRQKATVANMHRLGVKNVITCAHDGRRLSKIFRQFKFDRILLDAPCSGLGVISRDPSVKVRRSIADVKKIAHLQKELLLAAIDVLNHKSKTGGVMVYSTCSVSVAENEDVVNYALQKRDIKIVDADLDFGTPGFTRYQQKRFHPSVAKTRRFYPHVHNMDGFYVAKIQKLGGTIKREETKSSLVEGTESDMNSDESKPNTNTTMPLPGYRGKIGKKRKTVYEGIIKRKHKKARVSVPPKKKSKTETKEKSNVKVTKPRRKKTYLLS